MIGQFDFFIDKSLNDTWMGDFDRDGDADVSDGLLVDASDGQTDCPMIQSMDAGYKRLIFHLGSRFHMPPLSSCTVVFVQPNQD